MPFVFKVPPPPSNAWKIQLSNYDNVSFIATNATTTNGMYVQPAGNVLYTTDDGANGIRQYNMTTPWDLSTAYANGYKSVTAAGEGETIPNGITFKPDGTTMYCIGFAKKRVFQYALSTPWDIQTATYSGIASFVYNNDSVPSDVQFSTDGTKMFICSPTGTPNAQVYQYNLTTAWDVSSAVDPNISYTIIEGSGMFFRDDGKKLYATGSSADNIHQHTLTTAWDLTTASYDNIYINVHALNADPQSISWKPDGLKFFVIGGAYETIYQYSIPV